MPSEVVLVQGSSIRISETAATSTTPTPLPAFESLDCIGREVQYQGGTATENDVTTLCSTAKEFRLGLEDAGTMTVTGHWVQTNAAHKVIRQAAVDKQPRLIDVVFSDGSVFRVLGIVSQRSWDIAVDGVVSATFAFRLTGSVLEIDAT